MSEMELMKIDGLSEVGNNVVNKISSAVSWLFTRETPKRIAVKTYIEDIQKSELDPVEKAVLITRAKKDIKEYSNQYEITQRALSHLKKEVKADLVDNDWLLSFYDKARLVSDESFQEIWARILAGEFENPGSYSMRTLEKLKSMSKEEAMSFSKLASLSIYRDTVAFLLVDDELMNKHGVYFSDVLKMEECGLMSAQNLALTLHTENLSNQKSSIDNRDIICLFGRKEQSNSKDLVLEVYTFSTSGFELLSIADVKKNNDYFLDCIKKLAEKNKAFSFSAHKILSFNTEMGIRYYRENLLFGE